MGPETVCCRRELTGSNTKPWVRSICSSCRSDRRRACSNIRPFSIGCGRRSPFQFEIDSIVARGLEAEALIKAQGPAAAQHLKPNRFGSSRCFGEDLVQEGRADALILPGGQQGNIRHAKAFLSAVNHLATDRN